jgi:hypothetical protein
MKMWAARLVPSGSPVMWLARAPEMAALAARQLECAARCDFTV